MGQEYKKLFRLNAVYMENEGQYFRLLDQGEGQTAMQQDYNTEELDVVPVADPTMSSDVQRIAKSQAIGESISGRPNVNEDEITKRMIEAINVPDAEKLVIPEEERQEPPPDPMVMLKGRELFLKEQELELDTIKTIAQIDEIGAKIEKLHAEAIKAIAQAEAEEVGPQLQSYVAQVQQLGNVAKERINMMGQLQIAKEAQKNAQTSQQGGGGPVAAGGGNAGGTI